MHHTDIFIQEYKSGNPAKNWQSIVNYARPGWANRNNSFIL
jgi:hypothetical protein